MIEIPIAYPRDMDYTMSLTLEKGFKLVYYYYNDNSRMYYVGQTSNMKRRHKEHLHNDHQIIDKVLKVRDLKPHIVWIGPEDYVDEVERYFIS